MGLIMSTDLLDGIYFDLDDEKYHALERMSASGICKMLVSPPTFWANSWLNPNREEQDKDTPAQILGRAYHVARLEPHLLDEQFVCEIDPDDYEGILTTSTQIQEKLASIGEPKSKKGEKVLDKAKRLKEAGYDGPILNLLLDEWELNRAGRVGIAPKYWKKLQIDVELFRSRPEIVKHFTGGFSEVSVLWTDERTGVKMKCRYDYLKADSYTDFKTFHNSMCKNLEQCIADTFRYNRYYIQAYLYWRVAELIRSGKIHVMGDVTPTDEQRALIEKIRTCGEPIKCWYVFQEKNAVPNLLAREVHILTPPHYSHQANSIGVSHEKSQKVAESTRRLSSLGLLAEAEVNSSISLFAFYQESYKRGEPWGSLKPTGVLDDDCFSPYWLEGSTEQ